MNKKLLFFVVGVLAVCQFGLLVAMGQTTSGDITGRVVDPKGEPLVNIEVTLVNQLTGAERIEATGDSGDFAFASEQPGTFSVLVKAPGFKVFTKKDLVLTASERLSAGNLQLQIGAIEETVTVQAETTPVQTTSSERSALLDRTQLETLMTQGRDFLSLAKILPGVVGGGGASQLGVLTSPTVNGVRSEYNQLSIDGVIGNTRGLANLDTPLNMDAISEVKILQNNYQAEYGGSSGSMINAVTKAGARDFHGSAYYYKRHEQFNASNFFNSAYWASADPVTGLKTATPKQVSRFDTIGYNVGGPIWVPGKFNADKSKLFFFFSQEILPTTTRQTPLKFTMPTPAMVSGNFSQLTDAKGVLIPIADPLLTATGKVCKKGGDPGCFPGNIIPSNRINADMQKMLALLPAPNFFNNAVSGGNYNYTVSNVRKDPVNQKILRLDYNLSSRWHAYLRGMDMTVKAQGVQTPASTMTWLTAFPIDYNTRNPNIGANLTYIASSTLINELNLGWAGWTEEQILENPAAELSLVQKSSLGMTLGQFNPQINPLGLIPRVSFGAGNISNAPVFGWDGRFPMRDNVTSFGLTDGVTKVWDAHMLKLGADIHFDRYVQQRAVGNFSGNFDFGANASNPLNTNYGYSNALLGDFNSYTEPNARPDYDPHTKIFEWYGQDSWKAAKNLTLDYGMRFTWAMPQTLHIGANFVPSIYDANQKPVLYVPVNVVQGGKTVKMAKDPTTGTLVSYAYVGAVVPGVGNQFNGLVSTPNALTQGQGMLLAPRIGFAWDVNGDGKTAIRGGSGIFYNARPRSGQEGDMTTNPPNVQNPIQNWSSIATLFSTPNAVFPTNLNRALQLTGKTPVMYNSSLGIQRAVGFGTVIDVAYVGTIGRHLGQSVDLNALAPGARFISAAANQDPTNPGKSLADNFLRPYPGLGSIPYLNFESNSSYHSLQAQLTHRFSRGVEFGVAYTWSKAMDYTDDYNGTVAYSAPMRAYSYGLAGFDRTHNLTVNWLYDLPKGSRLLNVPIVRGVFDNWQLSGIASFVSGAPTGIVVTSTANVDFTGGGDTVRARIVGNPILDKGTRNVLQFFNTAAIAMPTPNTATSISGFVGNAGKDVFRGPGSQNWDVSLLKNIPIKDRISFQLRCEAYNLFNHPNFTTVDTAAKFNALGVQTNTTFGQVTAASAARSLQLAGRITF